MSRRAQTFRQRDMTAAIRAVERAGLVVARAEVGRDGKIVIIPAGDAVTSTKADDGATPLKTTDYWDQVLA